MRLQPVQSFQRFVQVRHEMFAAILCPLAEQLANSAIECVLFAIKLHPQMLGGAIEFVQPLELPKLRTPTGKTFTNFFARLRNDTRIECVKSDECFFSSNTSVSLACSPRNIARSFRPSYSVIQKFLMAPGSRRNFSPPLRRGKFPHAMSSTFSSVAASCR